MEVFIVTSQIQANVSSPVMHAVAVLMLDRLYDIDGGSVNTKWAVEQHYEIWN